MDSTEADPISELGDVRRFFDPQTVQDRASARLAVQKPLCWSKARPPAAFAVHFMPQPGSNSSHMTAVQRASQQYAYKVVDYTSNCHSQEGLGQYFDRVWLLSGCVPERLLCHQQGDRDTSTLVHLRASDHNNYVSFLNVLEARWYDLKGHIQAFFHGTWEVEDQQDKRLHTYNAVQLAG